MGNTMCLNTPKKKIICGHVTGVIVFAFLMAFYAGLKFIGDGDNPPVNDEGCRKFPLRGPEDITPVGPSTALISSDDRQNWLIHENIEQTGVEQGKIALLGGMDEVVSEDTDVGDLKNLVTDSGFPSDKVDFHPHGMALTPEWVVEKEGLGYKQLFVINHAWNKGGERIEVFKVKTDNDGDVVSLEW